MHRVTPLALLFPLAVAGAASAQSIRIDESTRTYTLPDGSRVEAPTIVNIRPFCAFRGEMCVEDLVAHAEAVEAADGPPVQIIGPTAKSTGGLTITFNFMNAAPDGAAEAFAEIADLFHDTFSDPVNISIDVIFNDAAFGSTSTPLSFFGYPTARSLLINDADADDTVQALLPSPRLPYQTASGGTVLEERFVWLSPSLVKATGGSSTGADATITLGTDSGAANFDFNPYDGFPFSQFSARDVIAHEVCHALGFSSFVGTTISYPVLLDLFRFEATVSNTPTSPAEFTNTPRFFNSSAASIGEHVYTDLAFDGLLSNGVDAQASHWIENGNNAPAIGLMTPVISNVETAAPFYLRRLDIAALDAVGWDYVETTGACNAADLDADGDNDLADALEFVNAFDESAPECNGMNGPCNVADVDGDGDNDLADALEFVNTFDEDC